jgi:hypothetical protein
MLWRSEVGQQERYPAELASGLAPLTTPLVLRTIVLLSGVKTGRRRKGDGQLATSGDREGLEVAPASDRAQHRGSACHIRCAHLAVRACG